MLNALDVTVKTDSKDEYMNQSKDIAVQVRRHLNGKRVVITKFQPILFWKSKPTYQSQRREEP